MSTSGPKAPGFTLDRLLGRGGSGEVWSARVDESGDRVALKFLTRVAPGAATEAAVLETLDHPHLVRMLGMLSSADGSVLVLDLAEGGSLARLLDARGRLAVGEVVTALSPIALALAHAHLNGVVHADVTPGNILFTGGGLPLLADLGMARLTGDGAAANITRCTPEYVDPSVANGSVPTAASDVFMLAAVAVHALTGSPLWPGRTPDQAFAAARAADLSSLAGRLRAAQVPAAVAEVVLRATDLDPMRRGTAASFGLDLRQAAEPVPVDLTVARLRAADGPAVPRSRRHAAPTTARGAAHVFTRIVGSRPKPALPAASRGRLSRLPRLPRLARLGRLSKRWSAVVAFLLAGLGGAGVAWAVVGAGPDQAGSAPHTSAVALPALPAPGGIEETLGATAAPSASVPSLDVTDAQVSQVLTQLDSLRQRAFATRIPLLLTGVYPTGPLLTADTSLLEHLVPAGCGLEGVTTTYNDVSVASQSDGTIVVNANVSLQKSYLVCGGRITASAPGNNAQLLRITLVWRGNGYLIGDIARG